MDSILIVDDHDLFREGLRKIIEHWSDFIVIGEASNGREAINLANDLFPDIILMDISMPGMDGLATTKTIARELPAVKIVILTASDDDINLFTAINYGACGYVLKNVPARRLHGLLQEVSRGEVALSSHMASKIILEYKKDKEVDLAGAAATPLTNKELQILELVAQGKTNAEIAQQIFMSEHSVKKYLGSILQKLHLNNRVEAAVFAVRAGIVRSK